MDSMKSVLGGPGSYPISAVIIAQDDEVRISKAIQSCRLFADEVVVIDGGAKTGRCNLPKVWTAGCSSTPGRDMRSKGNSEWNAPSMIGSS
ncbi:hypothetical protein [Paenibacillus sonchi]|uniref:hypothetical protein n=1 Tax=Paenibacillus sonchi TaxID=373687 RepID=UPI001F2D5C28|nr:hypothetical protein [Paenibacillus sonchi]